MSSRPGLAESADQGVRESLHGPRRPQHKHALIAVVSVGAGSGGATVQRGRHVRATPVWPVIRAVFVVLLVVSGLFSVGTLPNQGPTRAGATDAGAAGAGHRSGAQSLIVGAWTRPALDRDVYAATTMEELLAARAAAEAAAAEAAATAAAEAAIAAAESAKLEMPDFPEDTSSKSSETYSDPADDELAAFLVGRSESWVRPVDAPVSSAYGPREILCTSAGCSSAFHDGVDFGAACGSPVAAVSAGRVVFVGPAGAYGNRVIVDHGQGTESIYGHIQEDSYAVEVGELIETGAIVGEVGMTGVATGCHLDLKIRVDGEYLSPVPYLTARGVPM